jgi:hypothetical protein
MYRFHLLGGWVDRGERERRLQGMRVSPHSHVISCLLSVSRMAHCSPGTCALLLLHITAACIHAHTRAHTHTYTYIHTW